MSFIFFCRECTHIIETFQVMLRQTDSTGTWWEAYGPMLDDDDLCAWQLIQLKLT